MLQDMKIEKKFEVSKKPKNRKRIGYVGLIPRICILFILLIIFVLSALITLRNSFEIIEEQKINYSVNGNVDYIVNLKENEYYEENSLTSGMVYVASLIDSLDIFFNYKFDIDKDVDVEFNYNIYAKLSILNDNGKLYYEKEYPLTNSVTEKNNGSKDYNISTKVSIDYDYYNKIANEFKNDYNVSTISKLTVFLKVAKKSIEENVNIENKDTLSIEIPLSEKTVNIKMQENNLKNAENIIIPSSKKLANIGSFTCFIISIIIISFIIYRIAKFIKILLPRNNKYDKYLRKIMLSYDRMIVETKFLPDFDNYQVIKVADFKEMLDVRDNLKTPIMYYNVVKHQKCHFYIINENNLYLITIKAIDFESGEGANERKY